MHQRITIRKDKLRAMHNRHPWIFSGAVAHMPQQIENGEIVEIADQDDHLIGYGFYAPGNQIVCRVFEYTHEPMPVHTAAYWHQKIAGAYALRKAYVQSPETNAYRLLHAEGDFFPGVIADVYNDIVSVQLLIKGTERIREHIVSGLQALGFRYIYNKSKAVSERLEGVRDQQGWMTADERDVRTEILENGVKFWVNVETGQKTGFFLDQRDARALVGHYSRGNKVLNTFSYSGGFSMYALQAGAELVHSVDSSQKAVDLCTENVLLNGFAPERHEGICADVFDFLKKMDTPYDVIILDPPAFAKTAKALPNATRGYKELNLMAFRKIKPGGILFTFSCSQKVDRDLFRKIVFGAAADAKRNVRILHQTTQPNCHPVNIFHPENEYLKGLVLQVE